MQLLHLWELLVTPVSYYYHPYIINYIIILGCNIVCTTLISAADSRFKGIKIKTILVDEAGQATEPEILIACVKGANQLILVGDHFQLRPILLSPAKDKVLAISLFERLMTDKVPSVQLNIQYLNVP